MQGRVKSEHTVDQLVLNFYGSPEEFSLALLGREEIVIDLPVGDYVFYPDSDGVKISHLCNNGADVFVVRGYSDDMLDSNKKLPLDLAETSASMIVNMEQHRLTNLMKFV